MGRKTIYTEAIAEAILGQLEKGTPLAEICRQEGMPAVRTVNEWTQTVQEFGARFARARADGWDAIAADCVKIADDESRDVIDDGKGGYMQNSTAAARARLRVETRLKLLAKWDPKRYGERIQIEEEINRKTLSRDEALLQLKASGLSVADVFGVLAKPAEPVLEIEGAKRAEKPQSTDGSDFVDIDM